MKKMQKWVGRNVEAQNLVILAHKSQNLAQIKQDFICWIAWIVEIKKVDL